jgi:hypothetical protein
LTASSILRFSPFRFDLANHQLWRDDTPVSLRPKTFAVLRYLVERAGHLVTRDELVAALWNNGKAETAPKHCIRGSAPLSAVRRRAPLHRVRRSHGYRFVAAGGRGGGDPYRAANEPGAPVLLVGREAELQQLSATGGAAGRAPGRPAER